MRVQVKLDHSRAAPQIDAPARVPTGGLRHDQLIGEVVTQQLLAERWPVIGDGRLGADEQDGSGEAIPPERSGAAHRRHAATDEQHIGSFDLAHASMLPARLDSPGCGSPTTFACARQTRLTCRPSQACASRLAGRRTSGRFEPYSTRATRAACSSSMATMSSESGRVSRTARWASWGTWWWPRITDVAASVLQFSKR